MTRSGKQKTIAIYCASLDKDKKPFNDPYYWDAYSDLLLMLAAKDVDAYLVTDAATYQGKGVFTEAYSLPFKGSLTDLQPVGRISADLVFDRGSLQADDVLVLNPAAVKRVGASKILTYQLFERYQPYSVPCYEPADLAAAVEVISGDMVVVKPDVGAAGDGVYVGPKANVETPGRFPVLVQEFMDTSGGVPGLANGVHDLRVEVGGGEIWGCYVRFPAAGSYKANIAQGGSKLVLSHRDVPPEVAEIVREIDASFGDVPRFYGLDFGHTADGWKLIEINSRRLGLVARSGGAGSAYTLERLADYLVELASK